jgi:hypothetical protein
VKAIAFDDVSRLLGADQVEPASRLSRGGSKRGEGLSEGWALGNAAAFMRWGSPSVDGAVDPAAAP